MIRMHHSLNTWKRILVSAPIVTLRPRSFNLELATLERLEASFVTHGDDDIARAFDWLEATAQQ